MILGAEPTGSAMRRGSAGPEVKAAQARLASLASAGSLAPYWNSSVKIGVDGQFGPLTEAAVRAFQSKRGLSADGVIGPATAGALGVSLPSLSRSTALVPSGSFASPGTWPWPKILIGVGIAGAAYWLLSGGGRELRRNPSDDDEEEEAERFYKKFHWGRRHKKKRRVKLSPTPRQLVKLGTLEAVTYSARKGASKLADYIHHFGEGGTKRPVLAADPKSRRLHVVGGGYDVKAAGIVG